MPVLQEKILMETRVFNDAAASAVYKQIEDHLAPLISRLLPDYKLHSIGINRKFETDEVEIRLHIRPVGMTFSDASARISNRKPLPFGEPK